MLLAPSRTKYRRQHRGRMKGAAQRGNALAFGQYGLQALEPCWMEARQIEAARIALTRFMKRGGKVWIRVFPDKPITAKPAETRMGSGKGAVDHWVAGRNRQFMACQAHGFFGDLFRYAANFEDNTRRLNERYTVIDSALTTTHTGFGRFGRNRLVWKNTDPHFTTTLHKAGECNTCGFDLASLHPAGFQGLQTILPKGKCVAPLGSTFHATAMLSAVFC